MTARDALSRDSGPRPVVSVVLPVYNGAGTIVDTIASVLQQTLAEFELIIIDDGSTDETLDMIAQISDGRIRIFSFEKRFPSTGKTVEYEIDMNTISNWKTE